MSEIAVRVPKSGNKYMTSSNPYEELRVAAEQLRVEEARNMQKTRDVVRGE
jgi:hypothetical protein